LLQTRGEEALAAYGTFLGAGLAGAARLALLAKGGAALYGFARFARFAGSRVCLGLIWAGLLVGKAVEMRVQKANGAG
jgi:hypothetical protein